MAYRRGQRNLAALGRVPQRIAGEILQRLLEAIGIAVHGLRARLDRPMELDAVLLQLTLVTHGHAIEQARHRYVLHAHAGAAALEPRKIEQVADDVLEPARLLIHDREVALARRG